MTKHIPDWLGFITKELVNNTTQYTDSDDEDEKPHFIVGNKPTIADFAVGAVFNQFFLNRQCTDYDDYHSIYVGFTAIKNYMKFFNSEIL